MQSATGNPAIRATMSETNIAGTSRSGVTLPRQPAGTKRLMIHAGISLIRS